MSLSIDSIVLVEFLSIEDCAKCSWTGDRIAHAVENNTHARVVRICFLACNREVEARAFQERAGIFDTVIVDDGTIRGALRLGKGTRYAVMSGGGEIIRELTGSAEDVEFLGSRRGSVDMPHAE